MGRAYSFGDRDIAGVPSDDLMFDPDQGSLTEHNIFNQWNHSLLVNAWPILCG